MALRTELVEGLDPRRALRESFDTAGDVHVVAALLAAWHFVGA
jgi:hypothetical protein